MNTVRYPAEKLLNLLQDQKVATMPQLKDALGTSVTYTVLRKLPPWATAAAIPMAAPITRWIPSRTMMNWGSGPGATSIFRGRARC
jgi:hypothetical protein